MNTMLEIYLDNAATTRVSDGAAAVMAELLTRDYGNPSSLHHLGYEAEKRVAAARAALAGILAVEPGTLTFTSCATESTNTALRGAARSRVHVGRHVLTSKGEHSATRETLKYLASQGWEIEYLENDESGRILLDDLAAKLRPDTALVTCLHVNNETGCIQPIAEMGALIREKAPRALFHVDAVQSFGKLPVFPVKYGIDLLSVSAHKINGPKGTGLLYVRKGLTLPPLIYGGGQEKGYRSGTENTAGICGFAQAAAEMWSMREELQARMMACKTRLYEGVTAALPDVRVNGPKPEEGAAHILNLEFKDIRSEVLLHALEDKGIYVSSGSACASNKPAEKSPTLASLGRSAKEIDSALRFSFGRYTTESEIDEAIRALAELVPALRRYTVK